MKTKQLIQGYSIIELLVALLILTLMMTVGFISYRDFERRQMTRNVYEQIKGDLHLALTSSTVGRKPDGCTGTLMGYEFEFVAGSSPVRYEVQAQCSGNPDIPVRQVTLPSEIEIVRPATNPILFKPLNQGTNLSNTVNITVRHAQRSRFGNYELIMTITRVGEIS